MRIICLPTGKLYVIKDHKGGLDPSIFKAKADNQNYRVSIKNIYVPEELAGKPFRLRVEIVDESVKKVNDDAGTMD